MFQTCWHFSQKLELRYSSNDISPSIQISWSGAKPKNTYSESPDVVHFCDLQLVETVPDVLEEKDLSHQLTDKSIYEVRFFKWAVLFLFLLRQTFAFEMIFGLMFMTSWRRFVFNGLNEN